MPILMKLGIVCAAPVNAKKGRLGSSRRVEEGGSGAFGEAMGESGMLEWTIRSTLQMKTSLGIGYCGRVRRKPAGGQISGEQDVMQVAAAGCSWVAGLGVEWLLLLVGCFVSQSPPGPKADEWRELTLFRPRAPGRAARKAR